jgi:hypothetical protein
MPEVAVTDATARDSADPRAARRSPAAPTPSSPAALLLALLEGLPAGDRSWVMERIRHYRTLAAVEEVSEGRF